MTASTRPDSADNTTDRLQGILDWAHVNSRWLGIAAAVVVVAAAGYWFYLRSNQIKAANADRALMTAKQSLAAQNTALAENDLQQILTRWPDTPAGGEAALLLAQTDYETGKYAQGIAVIERELNARGAGALQSDLYSMLGAGYSQDGKLAEAAQNYEKAAQATPYATERAFQQAKAARAYDQAGNVKEAVRVWTTLAQSDISGISAEAKLRLGELTAKPAS